MKKCQRCGIEKDISEFYVHKGMADGHLNFCKNCVKTRVSGHYRNDIESSRIKERERCNKRKNDPRYIEMQRKATAKYRSKLKLQSWSKLYKNRPDRCSKCQTVTTKLHAHHPDYDKPLEVIIFCRDCHYKKHWK